MYGPCSTEPVTLSLRCRAERETQVGCGLESWGLDQAGSAQGLCLPQAVRAPAPDGESLTLGKLQGPRIQTPEVDPLLY